MSKFSFIFLFLCFCNICYGQNTTDLNVDKALTGNYSAEQCKINGGKPYYPAAMFGKNDIMYCQYPYADGGKNCTSSSQCSGGCVTNKISNLGKQGVCRSWPQGHEGGCLTPIEDGRITCSAGDMRFICPADENMCSNFKDQENGYQD